MVTNFPLVGGINLLILLIPLVALAALAAVWISKLETKTASPQTTRAARRHGRPVPHPA